MSREVEYGIKVTAVDALSAPMDKATASVKRFEASTRQTQAALQGGMRSILSFGQSLGKTFGAGLSALKTAAAAVAPALNVIGVVVAATSAVVATAVAAVTVYIRTLFSLADAAGKVEQIEIRAAAAIRSRSTLTEQEFEALKRRNAERERQLGIDADLQLQAQGTLAAMGVQRAALDLATRATIGLSNATGQGLNEAARVVAKAFSGNTSALQEYGIKVKSVGEAQAKFQQLFEIVTARSGTYTTRIEALKHAWGGLGEAFGDLVVKNPAVMRVLDAITEGIESLTKSMNQSGKTAAGLKTIVTASFQLIGNAAELTTRIIANSIKVFDKIFGAKNLARLADNISEAAQDLRKVLAGGDTAGAQNQELRKRAAAYLDLFTEATHIEEMIQRNGVAAAEAGTRAHLDQLRRRMAVMIEEETALSKTRTAGALIAEAEDLARERRANDQMQRNAALQANEEARQAAAAAAAEEAKKRAEQQAQSIAEISRELQRLPGLNDEWIRSVKAAMVEIERMHATGTIDAPGLLQRFDIDVVREAMSKMAELEREAIAQREQREREAQEKQKRRLQEDVKRIKETERAKEEAAKRRIEAQLEAERQAQERSKATFEELKSFFGGVGQNLVSLFGDAWSTIGALQNKTTTEIVRNEKGLLEERTRITEQSIVTIEDALGKFLSDSGKMFAQAALQYIAIEAVKASVAAIASAIGTFGLLGLVLAGGAAATAMALVNANKAKVPPPQKFFVGGVVPGQMGVPRLAVVEGGERVTSVADRVDGRGSGNATVVINNNLLAAPSRVQMERVNRDAVMPSMRRLQRLGFAS